MFRSLLFLLIGCLGLQAANPSFQDLTNTVPILIYKTNFVSSETNVLTSSFTNTIATAVTNGGLYMMFGKGSTSTAATAGSQLTTFKVLSTNEDGGETSINVINNLTLFSVASSGNSVQIFSATNGSSIRLARTFTGLAAGDPPVYTIRIAIYQIE